MNKFVIPAAAALALATLTGLGIYGSKINATCVPGNADYAAGTGLCTVKNAEAATKQAKSDAEAKVKATAEAKADALKADRQAALDKMLAAQPKTDISQDQFIGCEVLLQRTLNDPDSYKRIGSIRDAMATGVLHYTATNGFGGRVQAFHSCNG